MINSFGCETFFAWPFRFISLCWNSANRPQCYITGSTIQVWRKGKSSWCFHVFMICDWYNCSLYVEDIFSFFFFLIFYFLFLFIYLFFCSEFCHTLKWKGLGHIFFKIACSYVKNVISVNPFLNQICKVGNSIMSHLPTCNVFFGCKTIDST